MRLSFRNRRGPTVSAISAIGLAAILFWMVIIPADIVAVLVAFAAAAIFQGFVTIAFSFQAPKRSAFDDDNPSQDAASPLRRSRMPSENSISRFGT
jgi:Mg2+/citrate symporter